DAKANSMANQDNEMVGTP
nr:serine proteinase (EC 3.4.21.-), extracellular - Lactococcus lactis subsp. cremoris (strain NCDO 1201) (fragments) [Lactococcus cremoris]